MNNNKKPLIGVILGSSAQGRLSEVPAHWIYGLALQRNDLRIELLDMGDAPLPFYAPATALPAHGMRRWSTALDRVDGFVVIVPERDDDRRPGLTCGLDEAGAAFAHKPVAFVGYGGGAHARRIDALRSLASELQMAPMRGAVHMTISEVMSVWQMELGFEDHPHLVCAAQAMLDELSWWAHALRPARTTRTPAGAGSGRQRAAASAISLATASGCEVMTTCEPPLSTTVFTALARAAMNAWAAGGMFLSRSP